MPREVCCQDGACPSCSPDTHEPECVSFWASGGSRCVCDVLREIDQEVRGPDETES